MQVYKDELYHWGIKGMKWGVRRYQNKDGTLTAAGKKHYAGDGNAGEDAQEPKTEYAPKRTGKNAEDYSDEELRARINRLQMERRYRDLQGQTNIRVDDLYSGQSFVKTVMTNASQQFLTKAVSGAMSYSAKQFITNAFDNPELANAIVSGSAGGNQQKKDDDKKDS